MGKITIKFATGGYGGKEVSKSIVVECSDPKRSKFYLKLKGNVESFANISPKRFRLIGYYKDKIKSEIKIVSKEKYPFRILNVSIGKENTDKVKIDLKRIKEEKVSEYNLTVENLTEKRGRFFDSVLIKTDSKLKPVIKIPLSAIIFDK